MLHNIFLFQQFVNRVRRQFFSGLTRSLSTRVDGNNTQVSPDLRLAISGNGCYFCGEAALLEAIRPHLCRWIDAFLVHISLVRPLSEAGQLQLATDCVELAAALGPLTQPNLGLSLAELVPEKYAQLCALKPYLIASTEEIVEVCQAEIVMYDRNSASNYPLFFTLTFFVLAKRWDLFAS